MRDRTQRRTPRKASRKPLSQRRGWSDPAPPTCRACGKLCFKTRKLAAAWMCRVAAANGEDRAVYGYYRCPSGNGWWHFGHHSETRESRGLPPLPKPTNERVGRDDPT